MLLVEADKEKVGASRIMRKYFAHLHKDECTEAYAGASIMGHSYILLMRKV